MMTKEKLGIKAKGREVVGEDEVTHSGNQQLLTTAFWGMKMMF
jgi:hypothetical protein